MTNATLKIDLPAIIANWRALDAMSGRDTETAAVVKADGYGLDAGIVSQALAEAGAKTFFVALTSEAVAVRRAVGTRANIYVFSGLMKGDEQDVATHNLIPLLNSPEQAQRFSSLMPNAPYGIQLDTGMNRLGMEANEYASLPSIGRHPELVTSHLACADDPKHPQNAEQLRQFLAMTESKRVRRSLAATGGTLMGKDYHFDLCRPGVGLYGGMPFEKSKPVVHVSVPVIQTRRVFAGEAVGYAASWVAPQDSVIATIALGYADGLIRAASNTDLVLFADDIPCPIRGRVSMDLLTVDVTHLSEIPDQLVLLNAHQTVDMVAASAGTIGYEILTSLGARYNRVYVGA